MLGVPMVAAVFSLLILGAIVLFVALEERDFRLVAVVPTPTRTPTKTPRPTLGAGPSATSQSGSPSTPGAQPTTAAASPTPTPSQYQPPPTAAVASTAFTPQAYPPPLTTGPQPTSPPTAPAASPQPTNTPRPTTRPRPTNTPKPTATLEPLIQFTGEVFWLTSYSPNCGSMGIGKRFSQVVDAKGKPVAGVVIKLWWPDANPAEYIYSNPTGNDGAFEIALGIPRDFTAYVAVHSHWGNPVESSDTVVIQFQRAEEPACRTLADGGTGLGHQWAIVKWTKTW